MTITLTNSPKNENENNDCTIAAAGSFTNKRKGTNIILQTVLVWSYANKENDRKCSVPKSDGRKCELVNKYEQEKCSEWNQSAQFITKTK